MVDNPCWTFGDAEYCEPCRERLDKLTPTFRIVNGEGFCRECYYGKPTNPEELKGDPTTRKIWKRHQRRNRRSNANQSMAQG